MNNPSFQLNKVRRQLKVHGRDFILIRKETDGFGEPTESMEVSVVHGIYHETNSNAIYGFQNNSDAATNWPRKIPSMLCLWESAQQIQLTDLVIVNSKTYKISQIRNIEEANLVADILMEEVKEIDQQFPV